MNKIFTIDFKYTQQFTMGLNEINRLNVLIIISP